jgi:thiol-disulfide isomerase/thioredoxin
MRTIILFILFFYLAAPDALMLEAQTPSLNIGDIAPPLWVKAWLKGEPVRHFEKGKVYVVEFWATWCAPCRAVMPHLSALAAEYKDKVIFLGIDVMEGKTASINKLQAFVDSMGRRMNYLVAAEDKSLMADGWLYASGEQGIPKTFVINGEGRLAWIGAPERLHEILPKILDNTLTTDETNAQRIFDKRLAELDDSANFELIRFRGDPEILSNRHRLDSALLMINEFVKKEPRLQYAPSVGTYTFTIFLQTDPEEAYHFGKVFLATPTYEDPPYHVIIGIIGSYSYKLNLPNKIYELAAEAYQKEIDRWPQTTNIPNNYHKMAEWYWRACNTAKAIESEQNAITALKSKENLSVTDLAAFESRLNEYKKAAGSGNLTNKLD